MRLIKLTILIFLCSVFTTISAAQPLNITTPRGDVLQVIADYPAGNGPFAAVILAPGQGYHMALPVMVETAGALVQSRVAVFRFNWAYFSKDEKKGVPSNNLTAEIEDMMAVLNHAMNDSRIAKNNIVVGGKSLGSVVAWQLLLTHKNIKAGLFITPVCERAVVDKAKNEFPALDNYPNIATEMRPLAFIAGDEDPLCKAKSLYRLAALAGDNIRVAVISGNHGFANPSLTGTDSVAATNRNVKLPAMLANDFVITHTKP